MKSIRKRLPVGWLAAVFVIFILISTYVMTQAYNEANGAVVARDDRNDFNCERHSTNKYISIGGGPVTYSQARMTIGMRACWRATILASWLSSRSQGQAPGHTTNESDEMLPPAVYLLGLIHPSA